MAGYYIPLVATPQIGDNGGGGGGGGGSGVLVVGINQETGTLDKTWQEIHDADFAIVEFRQAIGDDSTRELFFCVRSTKVGNNCIVYCVNFGDEGTVGMLTAETTSPEGYPVPNEP